MQLQQVDSLGAKILQPLMDVVAEIGCRVSVLPAAVRAGRPGPSIGRCLGRDQDLLFSIPQNLRDDPLATAVSISRGRVDEVDPWSIAVCRALTDSASSWSPQPPPIAHAPKPISETCGPASGKGSRLHQATNC